MGTTTRIQRIEIPLLVFLLLSVVVPCDAQTGVREERVRVNQVVGRVEFKRGSGPNWRSLRVGMPVKSGWDIRTYMESETELEFESGTIIRVGENTIVTVSDALIREGTGATKTKIDVATGQVWANVKKLANQRSRFRFETPTATASIRGTRLGINVGSKGTAVDVYEGLVVVAPRGNNEAGVPVSSETRAIVTSRNEQVKVRGFGDSAEKDSVENRLPAPRDPFVTEEMPPDSLREGSQQDTTQGSGEPSVSDTLVPGNQPIPDTTASRANPGGTELVIESPSDNETVSEQSIEIRGRVGRNILVKVGEHETRAGRDGTFRVRVSLEPGPNSIPVTVLTRGAKTLRDLKITYRPPIVLDEGGLHDNMVTGSSELPLDINVSEGAQYSVNGTVGAQTLQLTPGKNTVRINAWDNYGGLKEKSFTVEYRPGMDRMTLLVQKPQENLRIEEPMIPVAGTAAAGARVLVNGVPIPVSPSGFFNYRLPVPDEPQDYIVEVVSELDGRQVRVERSVVYEPERQPLSLSISSPADGQRVGRRILRVAGTTAPQAFVRMGSNQTRASASGIFEMEQTFSERDIGEYYFEVVAESEDRSEEMSRSVTVVVDPASAQINTSSPSVVVQAAAEKASRNREMVISVMDRTPGDQITVTVELNGSAEEFSMESGGRQAVVLEEGKNRFSVSARDLAGNVSNTVSGEAYYLPGPLAIDFVEPMMNPYVIDDLPPMPRGVGLPRMDIEVEIDDGIFEVPEAIRYCRVTGTRGELLLRDNNDYTFSGTLEVLRGTNTFLITAEDIAGNTVSKRLEVIIEE